MDELASAARGVPLWLWPVAAAVSTVISLIAVTAAFVHLPADYFVADRPPHPLPLAQRLLWNVLGVLLLVVGGVMSLPGVPGQGLLTVLAALLLMDIPGKQRLERRLLARPALRRTIDRLRERWHRPPLLPPFPQP
ncbi:MAG: hypothetical protein HY902_12350 [Deltaproteobacteria bacterium]|nr:hypothetical protein [Deltaproteobacteria bacterium]